MVAIPRYTDEEKERAISLYFDSGLTSQEVVDRLGYPSRQNLELWLRKDARYGDGNFRHGFYPIALKREAVRLRLEEGLVLKDIASQLHIKNKVTVQKWVAKFEEEGDMGLVPKKKSAARPPICQNTPRQARRACRPAQAHRRDIRAQPGAIRLP